MQPDGTRELVFRTGLGDVAPAAIDAEPEPQVKITVKPRKGDD